MTTKHAKLGLQAVFILVLFALTFWGAGFIQEHNYTQELVGALGYFGVILISFISGINLVIPIPATAFIPIFIASEFSLISIVAGIVVGTTVADLLSFYIGTLGKTRISRSQNRFVRFLIICCEERRELAALVVFLYATLIPLPNEFLLLPLGALGFKLRHLIVPFVLGTILHVSFITFGFFQLLQFAY